LVNNTDFEAIRLNFLQSVTSRASGDLNADGFVDFADFRQWKAAAPGVGSNLADSIPEPTAYLLVVGMGLGMSLWTRRLRRSRPTSV
jgi:hypothetical protein